MNVGDKVTLMGVVKDVVIDKNNPARVSVLLGTVADASKEYWLQESDLQQTAEAVATAAAAEGWTPPAAPSA